MSDKRKALLAQKEKILEEIKYYERRIEEAKTSTKMSSFYEDDSSDSETEITLFDIGPSISELKLQQNMLKTCLQATKELTSLEVLQSEVNVLVDDPKLDGASPVKGDGVWREVVAECCLDLVPFAISFYTFKANRTFAPTEYRSLRVTAIKKAHEMELSKSILPGLTRPSDAVEVIRSYAVAHRSRRATLARLANNFSDSLHLEPLPEGGYHMKCANLMEMSWTLRNRWSPMVPFHHHMKFDFDYMDEGYVKTITLANRQLSKPDLETDERTFLLAKIISTCLEAQGLTQELHDSMSSDPETVHTLDKQRTTRDREPEAPSAKRAKNDSEVMAPPKGPPKKAKKGKENVNSNKKTTKRPIEHNENANIPKKAKTTENSKDKETNNEEITSDDEHSVATSKNNEPSEKSSAISKSDSIKKKSAKHTVSEKETRKKANEQHEAEVHNTEKPSSAKKNKKAVQNNAKTVTNVVNTTEKTEKPIDNVSKETTKVNETSLKSSDKVMKSDKKVESTKASVKNIQKINTTDKIAKKSQIGEKVVKDKDTAKFIKKTVPKNTGNIAKNDNVPKHNDNSNKNAAGDDNTNKNNANSNANKLNNKESTEPNRNINVASDKNKTAKSDVAGNTVGKNTKKIVSTEKNLKKPDKIVNKETGNNVQKVKTIASVPNTNANVTEKVNKVTTKAIPGMSVVATANKNGNVASAEKNPKKNPTQTKVAKPISNINAEKMKNSVPKIGIIPNKPKATIPTKKIIIDNSKTLSNGNSGKENAQNNSKISKIPLKKFSSENALQLPSRASPRQPLKSKVLSKFGSGIKLKPK